MKLVLEPELRGALDGRTGFEDLMSMAGEERRAVAGRRTARFECSGRGYFIKVHTGVGWLDIAKSLVLGRLPVVEAGTEYRALRKLQSLGFPVPRVVGYGRRGVNPARLRSFLVTEELKDRFSLEEIVGPGLLRDPLARRALVEGVATLTRRLHEHGVNHRDLYIGHFLARPIAADAPVADLALVDLHRAQVRPRTPRRWRVKDLGSLHWSAASAGLTGRDRLRFLKAYAGAPLRQVRSDDLWREVEERALRLFLRHGVYGHAPGLGRQRRGRRFSVWRSDRAGPALPELLSDPERPFARDDGWLKREERGGVVAVTVAGRCLVVKRWRVGGLLHTLRRLLRPSRGATAWKAAHAFELYGVAAAAPVALVEERIGPVRRASWLVSEFVEGEELGAALAAERDPRMRYGLLRQVATAVERLRRGGWSHGDLKATNLRVSNGRVVFLDLDHVRQHRSAAALRRAITRDRRRFLRNWEGRPELLRLAERAWPEGSEAGDG